MVIQKILTFFVYVILAISICTCYTDFMHSTNLFKYATQKKKTAHAKYAAFYAAYIPAGIKIF